MRRIALGLAAAMLASAAVAQPPRTLADLQAAARTGQAEAQFRLGEAYRTGAYGSVDRDQAVTWLRRAADQGHQPSRDALGMLLFTRGNRQEAMPLIEAAAARGDARALYILATARFNGDYVARDWPRSYAEMSRAAELGLPQAKASLAQMEPYLLPSDRAKGEQIKSTMSAVAPAYAAPLPRAEAPAAPAPVAAPTRTDTYPPPMVAQVTPPAAADLVPQAAPPPARRPAAPARPVATASPTAARGTWRVQLGAYGSRERAEAQWTSITAKVSALSSYERLVSPAGPALFRLQADGIGGREAANALCRQIQATGAGCFPVAP